MKNKTPEEIIDNTLLLKKHLDYVGVYDNVIQCMHEFNDQPKLTDISRRYFLITKVNTHATGVSNIIGITDDEEYAKSRQSVFCTYREVEFLKK